MSAAFVASVEPIAPGDALLHPAPLSHGSGLYLLPHVAGGAVSVVPESGGFDADGDLRAAVDVGSRRLLRGADDGEAARRRARDRRRAARSAEVHRLRRRADVRGRCQGGVRDARAAPRADLRPGRIADDDHRDEPRRHRRCDPSRRRCAPRRRSARRSSASSFASPMPTIGSCRPGDVGEILVRGPTVMRGYWRNPEATREHARATAFSTPATSAGWIADGFLTLIDRSKDLIISGGSNIYPREVEEALLLHPDVAEARWSAARTPTGARRSSPASSFAAVPRRRASGRALWNASSTRGVSSASRASSGRRPMSSSPSCPRTTPARC